MGTGVAAVPVLWLLAHQPLTVLPAFARTSLWALSGYSEAMANGAALSRTFGFAAVSLLLLAACWLVEVRRLDRVLLGVMVAATLFVSFKSVAVRTHDMSEASALMVIAAVIVLLAPRPRLAPVAVVLILAVAWHPILRLTELHRVEALARTGGRGPTPGAQPPRQEVRRGAGQGPRNQLMPPASSDSDVYTVQQSDLLAQGKAWSPRPTLQSYAAYTPALAEMNRRHIVGPDAPRHLYYRSGRSTAGCPRWRTARACCHCSAATGWTGTTPSRDSSSSSIGTPPGRRAGARRAPCTASWVGLSTSRPPAMPGWLDSTSTSRCSGGHRSALWRPPLMNIELTLENGTVVSRRFIPTMARSEFLLSPYFPTTAHLATLFGARDPRRMPSAVRSFRLVTDGTPGWKPEFTFRLQPVEIPTYHPVATN